jgi:hypothetical protein
MDARRLEEGVTVEGASISAPPLEEADVEESKRGVAEADAAAAEELEEDEDERGEEQFETEDVAPRYIVVVALLVLGMMTEMSRARSVEA